MGSGITTVGPTIQCPKCKTTIPLTEAMAGPLLEAERVRLTAEVEHREQKLLSDQATFDSRVRVAASAEVERQRKEIMESAAADLRLERGRVTELNAKLTEAQAAQTDAVKAKREAEDMKRELELTIQKRVTEQGASLRAQAQRDAEAALGLKVTEREETITQLTRQVEELRLAAEQGSTRIQGEAQEIDLEQSLRLKFPMDMIEAVGKFVDGADVLQRVVGSDALAGKQCGVIIWESKRTKNWNENWLAKLRTDQRDAKAEVAIIISRALPDDVETFSLRDGVWVCAPRHAMTLGFLLRRALVEVTIAREVTKGQATKAELLYRYLTGPQFKQRVEAVAEKLTELRDDLDRERKSLTKQWAKREANLEVMATALAGMYGDVQGLAGKAVGELEGLKMPQLE